MAALISASVMRLSRAQSVPDLRGFAEGRFLIGTDFVSLTLCSFGYPTSPSARGVPFRSRMALWSAALSATVGSGAI
jgi:hypothetical protein